MRGMNVMDGKSSVVQHRLDQRSLSLMGSNFALLGERRQGPSTTRGL